MEQAKLSLKSSNYFSEELQRHVFRADLWLRLAHFHDRHKGATVGTSVKHGQQMVGTSLPQVLPLLLPTKQGKAPPPRSSSRFIVVVIRI